MFRCGTCAQYTNMKDLQKCFGRAEKTRRSDVPTFAANGCQLGSWQLTTRSVAVVSHNAFDCSCTLAPALSQRSERDAQLLDLTPILGPVA